MIFFFFFLLDRIHILDEQNEKVVSTILFLLQLKFFILVKEIVFKMKKKEQEWKFVLPAAIEPNNQQSIQIH